MNRISQHQCKELKKLHLVKYRYQRHEFLIEGNKIIQEALIDAVSLVKAIYLLDGYTPQYALPDNIPVFTLTEAQAKQLTQLQTFPKIMALMAMPASPSYNDEHNALFLESIRDPGNLGTIIRICDWYGIPQMLLTPDCADVYNAKTLQASMGSFMRVKCIIVDELPEKNVHVYTADLQGTPIENMMFKEPFILHLGNESKGIQKKLKNSIAITIPRSGKAESLNVGIAAAICLERIRTAKMR